MVKSPQLSWITLIIVSFAAFIIAFDSTFMNVAIINLVKDLNTTVGTVQAIITIYALVMASLMLLGAKLQDIVGRKKIFLIGAVIYGIGTLIAALSINDIMLLVGWSILEGVGAALMLPATASIITSTYEGARRKFAFGIWTGVTAMAAAVGPLLGGFLITFFSWRYGFAMELIIIIVILSTSKWITGSPVQMKWGDLDISGALLSAAGIFLIVLGILMLNDLSKWKIVPLLIIPGLIMLIGFYFSQKRRIKNEKEPLLDINLFKNRTFTLGNVVRILGNVGVAGLIFIIPIFMQTVLGANALITGIALLPLIASVLIISLSVGRITSIIKPAYLLSIGFLAATIGCILLQNVFTVDMQLIDIIPGTALIGIGCGLIFPVSVDMVLTSAGEKQSDASGVANTTSSLGSSIGTALIGVVLILGIFTGISNAVAQDFPGEYTQQELNQNIHGWVQKLKTTNLSDLTGAERSTVIQIADSAIANAMKDAVYGLMVMFLFGFIISLFIQPDKEISRNIEERTAKKAKTG